MIPSTSTNNGMQDVVCKPALVDEHPSQNLPYGAKHALTCTILYARLLEGEMTSESYVW